MVYGQIRENKRKYFLIKKLFRPGDITIMARWQILSIYLSIYLYGVELSSEKSNGCHSDKARLFEWIELSVAVKSIYVNITKFIQNRLKFTLVSAWLCGRIFGWCICQPGFHPCFETLAWLATQKSCDSAKLSVCGRQGCIRGVFNKLTVFFVQAFKIVVDSWKFTMLLLYIVWDDGTFFMISGSNEQLQQEL